MLKTRCWCRAPYSAEARLKAAMALTRRKFQRAHGALSIVQVQVPSVRHANRARHQPAPTCPNSASSSIAFGPHSGSERFTVDAKIRTSQSSIHPARHRNWRWENDSMADRVVEATRTLNPFQLTSFGTKGSRPLSQSELIDHLRELNQVRSENVEAMMLSLERLKAKARGFLSITGAPRVAPVVRPLTQLRFLILLVLCTSVWLLLIAWLHPIRANLLFWAGTPRSNETIPVARKTASKSDSSAEDPARRAGPTVGMKKTIHWMQREGIPYLGEIQILSGETPTVRDQLHINLSAAENASSKKDYLSFSNQSSHIKSITTLRSLSEGSLVLWMGLFVARVLFDPVWRELVAVAPLAAISRMITGIQ